MPYDPQGVFTRVMNWQDDAANDIAILASRHDAEDDNFANGFNEVLCRDGRAAMTGALKMGTNKITGLGNGTNSDDAVTKSQLDSVNTTLSTAITTAVNNLKQALFPVGSVYCTSTNTNPNSILGFGTWSTITTTVVRSVSNSVPVKGNGKAINIYDGSVTKPMATGSSTGNIGFSSSSSGNAGSSSSSLESGHTNTQIGLAKDGSKSGMIADTSSLATSATVYIWKRTA